jgi:teichuronic acid biosynthesis glycosyltransferase TuaG
MMKSNENGTTPLISIIMPCFNAAHSLSASVDSVLNQLYTNWELVIIDDASEDASGEIIESLTDVRIVKLRNLSNCGPAAARNLGLSHARGHYIAFLDSDDRWSAQKLALQVGFALETGERLSYCAYVRVDEAGRILGEVVPPSEVRYTDMLIRNHIPMLTGMYERAALKDLRFSAARHEDYIFWASAIKRLGRARRVPSEYPLAQYTVRNTSVSGDKMKAALWHWQNLRENFKLPFATAFVHFVAYAWHHAIARATQRSRGRRC